VPISTDVEWREVLEVVQVGQRKDVSVSYSLQVLNRAATGHNENIVLLDFTYACIFQPPLIATLDREL
jgi:hypothetical protein